MSYINVRGRNAAWDESLFRGLVLQLLLHGRLRLVFARAKRLQRKIEKLMTRGKKLLLAIEKEDKKGVLALKRGILSSLGNKRKFAGMNVLTRLLQIVSSYSKTKNSGFTRVLKESTNRLGDNSLLGLIEFVESESVSANN